MRSILGLAVLAFTSSINFADAYLNKCTPSLSARSSTVATDTNVSSNPSGTTTGTSLSATASSSSNVFDSSTTVADSSNADTSGTVTGTSPTSSATGLPQIVTNLLINGNFPSYHENSPGGLYDYEITEQARQVSGQGYTGDGSQETGSCELVVDQDGVLDKRQVVGTGFTSSIQQWLDIPFGPSSLTLQLYYLVLANQAASTCQLNVYFGGDLFASSPYFDVVAAHGNVQWGTIVKQADIKTRSGYLKFELSCVNGGAARLLIDQAFVTNLVGPEDLDKIQYLWPVFDGGPIGGPTTQVPTASTTATGISTTDTSTTANPDTTIESISVTGVNTEGTQTSSQSTNESSTGFATQSNTEIITWTSSTTGDDSQSTAASGTTTGPIDSTVESTTALTSGSITESEIDSTSRLTGSMTRNSTTSVIETDSETMPTIPVTRNSTAPATESNSEASPTMTLTWNSTYSATDTMPTMPITRNSTDSMPTMSVTRNSTDSMPSMSLTRNSTDSATVSIPIESTTGDSTESASDSVTTSWTISVSGTITPTASATTTIPDDGDHPLPTSLDDLSPGAREIYDYFVDNLDIDENGNVNVNNEQRDDDKELIPAPYNPDDRTRQQELEDELQRLGLPAVDKLTADEDEKVDNAEQGICPNDNKKRGLLSLTKSVAPRTKRQSRFMAAAGRFDKFLAERTLERRDAWDFICHDAVEAVMGVSETAESAHKALCAGKSLWDSRDGIRCLFGGCGPTVLYETFTYTWNYEWRLVFPSISSWLIKAGDSNMLSCVDCSFTMSSIKFTGQIVVIKAQGQIAIKETTLVPEITGAANLIVELKTNQAWTSSWGYTMESASLATIQSDSAYSIKSRILYNMGINFSADKAVNVKGGAKFSLNKARAELDMSGPTIKSQSGWQPSVSYVLPSFSTRGGVKLQPYMRWAVEFEVNIFDQVKITPAITSYSMVTMKSSFSTDPQGSCPANNLAVNTYVTTANNMRLFDDFSLPLWVGDSDSAKQCFEMPELVPSLQEIQDLASVGGEFCTSYLYYQPPKTTTYDTTTLYTPSTTITQKVTTTIPITTTKTETITTSVKMTVTAEPPISPVIVTGAGLTAAFGLQNLKREEITAAPAAPLAPRAVATPAMIQNWDRTKISFACKQVATGSSTITQTVSTTVGSGAVTTVATITENANGPLITKTQTNVWAEYDGYTPVPDPTSYEWATVPTATACAVPDTDSGKCFKIKIHGPDWVDGQYMKYWENGGFAAGNAMEVMNFDTFYLTDSGRLVTQDQRIVPLVIFAGYPWNKDYEDTIWASEASRDLTGHEPLLCSKDPDPCNKSLYCRTATRDGISFVHPAYYETFSGWLWTQNNYVHYRAFVGEVAGSVPATFTWEEAPCICGGTYGWQQRPDWTYEWEEGWDEGIWVHTG